MLTDTIKETLRNMGIVDKQMALIDNKVQNQKISYFAAVEQLNIFQEDQLLEVFSKIYNIEVTKLGKMDIPLNIIKLIPGDMAEKFRIIPIDRVGNNIVIATSNPENAQVQYSIKYQTGYSTQLVLASDRRIGEALKKYYDSQKTAKEINERQFKDYEAASTNQASRIKITDLKIAGGDGPIIKLVNDILIQCVDRRGSDIHIEPYESYFRIRLRVDGDLMEIARASSAIKDALISRVKIMANMDIAEKRLPQDGGIRVVIHNQPVDFRVNSIPTIYGEKIVLRLLDKTSLNLDMTALGFEKDDLLRFMDSIHKPYGIVLVTGPTGSGKTTTLYSALAELNKVSGNIMTAEDPVEYNLDGINQVQMKADIGLDFAAALRAFLRQDPDVIMVGEIRDLETAQIAVKAALTGHIVLSTLHTNTAVESILRLKNMGVETFNIASSLNAIVAQRLAKKICPYCKVVDDLITPDVLVRLGIKEEYASKVKAYKGEGCPRCNNAGTKGRVAIHEVLTVTETMKEAIIRNESSIELKRLALESGMRTLRQSALKKMAMGIISCQEVMAVTAADDEESEEDKNHSKNTRKVG